MPLTAIKKQIVLRANWGNAASPIMFRYSDQSEWHSTPYQVADVRHDDKEAYRRVWDWLERQAG